MLCTIAGTMTECSLTGGVGLNSQFMYFAILKGKNFTLKRGLVFSKSWQKNYAVIL